MAATHPAAGMVNIHAHTIFFATQRLLAIRKKIQALADHKNITWLTPHNIHVAGYLRTWEDQKLYCLFNFGNKEAFLTWYAFKEHGSAPTEVYDHWRDQLLQVGADNEYLIIPSYSFYLLEVR